MSLRPWSVTRQRRVRAILAVKPCACGRLKQRPTFALAFFGSSAQARNQRVPFSCDRMSRFATGT